MNIQEVLQNYPASFIRVMNWHNKRWLIWDTNNEKWSVIEIQDNFNLGKSILITDDEEEAVACLVSETKPNKKQVKYVVEEKITKLKIFHTWEKRISGSSSKGISEYMWGRNFNNYRFLKNDKLVNLKNFEPKYYCEIKNFERILDNFGDTEW